MRGSLEPEVDPPGSRVVLATGEPIAGLVECYDLERSTRKLLRHPLGERGNQTLELVPAHRRLDLDPECPVAADDCVGDVFPSRILIEDPAREVRSGRRVAAGMPAAVLATVSLATKGVR